MSIIPFILSKIFFVAFVKLLFLKKILNDVAFLKLLLLGKNAEFAISKHGAADLFVSEGNEGYSSF